jgi:ornithine carbamoyltransferase
MDTSTSYLDENKSKNTTVDAQPDYIITGQVLVETKHRAVQISCLPQHLNTTAGKTACGLQCLDPATMLMLCKRRLNVQLSLLSEIQ